jgi:hypothetical protein
MREVARTMLLPTKGIAPQRALLTVGASIIALLNTPATVSGLWERYSQKATASDDKGKVTFDWFAMALSMLFTVRAVAWNDAGQLVRCHVPA